MSDLSPRTWLAGDGQGVILVCDGDCPDTLAGDLVVAEYGETAISREAIRKFDLSEFAAFLAFAADHAHNCTPAAELDRDIPHWGPLRAVIPADQLDGWMWMNRSTYNGHIVEHYKHRETRGGITFDHMGGAWSSRVAQHGCSPWCEEKHEHFDDTYEHFMIRLDEAFKRSGVWPWSMHDKDHPWPSWMPRSDSGQAEA